MKTLILLLICTLAICHPSYPDFPRPPPQERNVPSAELLQETLLPPQMPRDESETSPQPVNFSSDDSSDVSDSSDESSDSDEQDSSEYSDRFENSRDFPHRFGRRHHPHRRPYSGGPQRPTFDDSNPQFIEVPREGEDRPFRPHPFRKPNPSDDEVQPNGDETFEEPGADQNGFRPRPHDHYRRPHPHAHGPPRFGDDERANNDFPDFDEGFKRHRFGHHPPPFGRHHHRRPPPDGPEFDIPYPPPFGGHPHRRPPPPGPEFDGIPYPPPFGRHPHRRPPPPGSEFEDAEKPDFDNTRFFDNHRKPHPHRRPHPRDADRNEPNNEEFPEIPEHNRGDGRPYPPPFGGHPHRRPPPPPPGPEFDGIPYPPPFDGHPHRRPPPPGPEFGDLPYPPPPFGRHPRRGPNPSEVGATEPQANIQEFPEAPISDFEDARDVRYHPPAFERMDNRPEFLERPVPEMLQSESISV